MLTQEFPKRSKFNVIYASQTGTAFDLALQFIKTTPLIEFKLSSIQNLQFLDQENSIYVFFIATTGQGEPPYPMRSLWKKMLKKDFKIHQIRFSIYGLGDTSYGDLYNVTARKFRQRLLMLGAQQIVQIGLGDQMDPKGYKHRYIEQWYPKMLKWAKENQFLRQNSQQNSQVNCIIPNLIPCKMMQTTQKEVIITSVKKIGSRKKRQTFMIQFQTTDKSQCSVNIGDVLCIYPHNDPELVKWALKYFDVQANKKIHQKIPSLQDQTYYQILLKEVNLSSTLNYSFFMPTLAPFVENIEYKLKLDQIALDYGEYYDYIKKFKRNIVQVIKDFDIKIPFSQFIKRIGPIIPRKYSIAQVRSQTRFGLLIRLVIDDIQNRTIKGVCSHDLCCNSMVGDLRKGYILSGGPFSIAKDMLNNSHLVIIALGTGIAPFLPILDFASNKQSNTKILLFYCNQFSDQLYGNQTIKCLKQHSKIQTFIGFTKEGGKRVPILLSQNLDKVQQFYQKCSEKNKFKILMCGPSQVYKFCCTIFQKGLGLDIKKCEKEKLLIYQHW